MMTKVKYQIGDIIAIPVRDGRLVFGQVLNDASLAVFNLLSKEVVSAEYLIGVEILFYPGVFDTAIVNGEWAIIGHIPIKNPDNSWPPPKYVRDIINPNNYQIYYKGDLVDAVPEDIKGLEEAVMYKPEQLIQEINRRGIGIKES